MSSSTAVIQVDVKMIHVWHPVPSKSLWQVWPEWLHCEEHLNFVTYQFIWLNLCWEFQLFIGFQSLSWYVSNFHMTGTLHVESTGIW